MSRVLYFFLFFSTLFFLSSEDSCYLFSFSGLLRSCILLSLYSDAQCSFFCVLLCSLCALMSIVSFASACSFLISRCYVFFLLYLVCFLLFSLFSDVFVNCSVSFSLCSALLLLFLLRALPTFDSSISFYLVFCLGFDLFCVLLASVLFSCFLFCSVCVLWLYCPVSFFIILFCVFVSCFLFFHLFFWIGFPLCSDVRGLWFLFLLFIYFCVLSFFILCFLSLVF